MMRLRSLQTKSTMYFPMGDCRLNLRPRSLRLRSLDQSSRSASVDSFLSSFALDIWVITLTPTLSLKGEGELQISPREDHCVTSLIRQKPEFRSVNWNPVDWGQVLFILTLSLSHRGKGGNCKGLLRGKGPGFALVLAYRSLNSPLALASSASAACRPSHPLRPAGPMPLLPTSEASP